MLTKLAHIGVLASAVGAAVISVPVGGFQLSLFRAIIAIMLFIAVADSLYRGRYYREAPTRFTYPHYFMLLWFAVSIAGSFFVKDFSGWLQGTFFVFIAAAATYLYSSAYSKTEDILKAMTLMSMMALVHNCIGWYESTTGNYLFFDAATEIYAMNGFAASTFANTNNFATYLTVSLAPLAITFKLSKHRSIRLASFAGLISTPLLILNSGSRANIIALILWTGTYLVISLARHRRTVLTVVVGAFTAALGLLVKTSQPGNTSSARPSFLSFNFDSGTNSEGIRINLILNGLDFLLDTFGIGVGAGNSRYWIEHFSTRSTSGIVNLHNWWLEILVEFGVVIFVGYVALCIYIAIHLWRSTGRSNTPATRDISGAILCSFVAFTVGSISASSILSSEWLWVFFGVAIAFITRTLPRNSASESKMGVDALTPRR